MFVDWLPSTGASKPMLNLGSSACHEQRVSTPNSVAPPLGRVITSLSPSSKHVKNLKPSTPQRDD